MVKKIALVSLSLGVLGESFVKHEKDLGLTRLEKMGITVKIMPNALKGIEYLKAHPEKRAEDFITAFEDDETQCILCAIGGSDTYRLLPYLFEDDRLKKAVREKIFLGFSDSTMNHFMLHKLGVKTFYGQAFLPDVCELEDEMLEYTHRYFSELMKTGKISSIRPSAVWHEARKDFSPTAMGQRLTAHKNGGFELLQGNECFEGEILGGCIEVLHSMLQNRPGTNSAELCLRYGIFPSKEEWRGKILLLETSDEKPSPADYKRMLEALKNAGVFSSVSGVIVGKAVDQTYFDEYKALLTEVIADKTLPVLYNVNVGHATPRAIVPFGVPAKVDFARQIIEFAS